MNWEHFAKNHFSARSLSDARSVVAHWTKAEDISLSEFAESTGILSEPIGTEKHSFIDNVGHSATAMHDLAVLEHKSQQCFRELYDNITADRAEFGNIIAYTFALFAAKTILGHLGIFFVRSRGQNFVFDFFPQFGDRSHQKLHKEAKKTISNPIKILFPGKQDITHSDVWSIVSALARKKNLTGCGYLDRWLKDFRYARDLLVRNKLLYTSSYWPLESINHPSANQNANTTQFFRQVARTGQAGPLADYHLSLRCMQMLKFTTFP